jgi:M6 family metalloprotease-like protein
VDDKPASPSDVVIVKGGFTGTRSFAFTREKLAAGPHSVRIQWCVDEGGKASVGDRTLTVYSSPELTKTGGLSVKAAPSGPDVTTRSGGFVDVPHMTSTVATAANSNLKITFTGEAHADPGKKVFVRALVDGEPAYPADVVFAKGGFSGARSFSFAKDRLGPGPHRVRIQWCVDEGGTAHLGDRSLALLWRRRQVPDLSEPFSGVKPVLENRKLLAILWDPRRPAHPAPSKDAVKKLLFGSKPSVCDYFRENSGGRFTIESAGVLGWYLADEPASHYWGPADQEDLPEDRNRNGKIDPGEDLNQNGVLDGPNGVLEPDEDTNGNGKLDSDLDGDGWIHGHTEKWAEAVGKADPVFDFAKYDRNRDGVLRPDELGILIVIPQKSPFGTVRPVVGKEYPKREPLVVDGVVIPEVSEAYIGSPPHLGLAAHELSHLFLKAADMYFKGFFPYAAGDYSLMDAHWRHPHLDPFHKLRLGWLRPKVVTASGMYRIRAVETHHEVTILCDPLRGDGEYFVLENRWPGTSYDSNLPDRGLAVWHVIEDRNIFGNLPAPKGVSAATWGKVMPHEWARRGVRMIRPVCGPPFDNSRALWDGSDPQTGYDLLSVDSNPQHATLTWADGTPSGFALRSIPAAGPEMTVHIEVK